MSDRRQTTVWPLLLVSAVVAFGLFVVWRRMHGPARRALRSAQSARVNPADDDDTEREQERAQPPSPSKPTAAEARAARDALRERIVEALRKRHASDEAHPSAARQAANADDGEPAGHYEPSYIQKTMRQDMFPLIRKCYESALANDPKLTGRLILDFTIAGDPDIGGVIDDANIDDASEITDPEMQTCVRESLMTLTFDKPLGEGIVTVKYPILFSPEPDDAGTQAPPADTGTAAAPASAPARR